jgi:hypothetical protein
MTDATIDAPETLARNALRQSGIFDLSTLQVERQDGRLVISGLVSRFYYKQLAQELVLATCKEIDLTNAVDVR